jgi:hypothetical protein
VGSSGGERPSPEGCNHRILAGRLPVQNRFQHPRPFTDAEFLRTHRQNPVIAPFNLPSKYGDLMTQDRDLEVLRLRGPAQPHLSWLIRLVRDHHREPSQEREVPALEIWRPDDARPRSRSSSPPGTDPTPRAPEPDERPRNPASAPPCPPGITARQRPNSEIAPLRLPLRMA